MIKSILTNIIIISGLITSCSPKINNYYAGIVVDEKGIPIENVIVEEYYSLSTLKTKTNKRGFFKLNRDEGIISNLKVEKNGYKSDTILTYNFTVDPKNWEDGETEYYSFLTSDTTKIVLKKDLSNNKNWTVNDIKDIKQIPYIENCNDIIFWNLVKQGKENIHDLIDKLTDETTLKNVFVPNFGGEYTVADVSLIILQEKINGIPIFELTGKKISKECGYCAYWHFVRKKKENRIYLQNNLKKWYIENEKYLIWIASNNSLTGDCLSPAKGHYEIKK